MKESDRDVLGANIDLIYRVGKLQFTNKFTAQQTKYSNPIVPFSDYAQAILTTRNTMKKAKWNAG